MIIASQVKQLSAQFVTTLSKRLDQFPLKKLEQDLGKFLPVGKKQIISSLKERIKQHLVSTILLS